MRELGKVFQTYCTENHSEWAYYFKYIVWVLNDTVHNTTGVMPQELFFKERQYSPIYKIAKPSLGWTEVPYIKYTLAREIQRIRVAERKRRQDL